VTFESHLTAELDYILGDSDSSMVCVVSYTIEILVFQFLFIRHSTTLVATQFPHYNSNDTTVAVFPAIMKYCSYCHRSIIGTDDGQSCSVIFAFDPSI